MAGGFPTAGIFPGGTVASAPAVQINAGPNDTILLRGLNLDGINAFAQSGGIVFNSGSKLLIHDCIVQNFSAPAGIGAIMFTPSGASTLVVTNTVISHNINGAFGAGILVKPSGSGSARVTIERSVIEGNGFGIVADGTGSSGGISISIADSAATGNANDGIIATTPSGGAPIGLMVTNSRSATNGFGLRSFGPNVTVRADRSAVIGNGTGLTFGSGGKLLSAGTNVVEANGSNGAFSGPVSPK